MHTITGVAPQHIVIGMPQAIIWFIVSQHMASMSMLIMPIGIRVQTMPLAVISQVMRGIIGMPQQLIIGAPAHIMPTGVPQAIMRFIMAQRSRIMSMVVPSPGIMVQTMPASVMAQVMRHIIGIMVAMGMLGMFIMGRVFIGICIAVFMGVLEFECGLRRCREVFAAA